MRNRPPKGFDNRAVQETRRRMNHGPSVDLAQRSADAAQASAEAAGANADARLKLDGTLPMTDRLRFAHPLSGATKAVVEHLPPDGDNVRFEQTAANAMRLWNQTTGAGIAVDRLGNLSAAGDVSPSGAVVPGVSGSDSHAARRGDTLLRAENVVTAFYLQTSTTNNDLRAVTTPAMRTNSADSRVLASHATDDAQRAVDSDAVKNAFARLRHFDGAPDSILRGGLLKTEAVSYRELNNVLYGGALSEWRLRKIEGSGSSGAAASANHAHSVPFAWMGKAERLRINALALRLREHRGRATGPLADLLEAMDDVLHMLCDDHDMDRWQREAMLSDPAREEEAKRYRRRHFMHHDGPVEPGHDELDAGEYERRRAPRVAESLRSQNGRKEFVT